MALVTVYWVPTTVTHVFLSFMTSIPDIDKVIMTDMWKLSSMKS